ncbi:MAG: hypothetical protein ACRC77_12930 [Bacteroidales bacterium]
MNYLKIARGLFDSSLWDTMSLSEHGLLLNLLNKVPFKEVTYTLYGRDIQLRPLEVCFTQRKMASRYNLSEYALKKMLHKFRDAGLITVERRKLSTNIRNDESPFRGTPSHNPRRSDSITAVTSVVFCASVVADFIGSDTSRISDQKEITRSPRLFDPHKNNVFKKINNKQDAEANPENNVNANPWYSLEAFTELAIYDARVWIDCLCEELHTDERTLTELIKRFCIRQKSVGYNQMTKVVFTQQFISYFNKQKRKNKTNNGKQTQQSAPENSESEDSIQLDRELEDLAAKCRRFGGNRSGGDDT